MSEELKDFQTAPTLTLNPFAEEEKAQPEVKKEEPLMDENVLSEEERKMQISCKSDRFDQILP